MRKEIKKFLSLSFLAMGVIFLAGCGAKNTPANAPMQKTTQSQEARNEVVSTPAPTGKVDATVDAIIGGADSEKMQATSDEADAKAAVDDSTSTNNLSKTYEQEL
jgi:uncharacterized lipoprotein YajG